MRAFDNKKKWDSVKNWRKANSILILGMVSQKSWGKKRSEKRLGSEKKEKGRTGRRTERHGCYVEPQCHEARTREITDKAAN